MNGKILPMLAFFAVTLLLFFSGCTQPQKAVETPIQTPETTETPQEETARQEPTEPLETPENPPETQDSNTSPGEEEPTPIEAGPAVEVEGRVPCTREFSHTFGAESYYEGPLFDAHLHMPTLIDFSSIAGHGEKHEPDSNTDPVLGKDILLEDILCLFEEEKVRGAIGFTISVEPALKEIVGAAKTVKTESKDTIHQFLMPTNFEAGSLEVIQVENPGLFEGYGEIAFYFGENRNYDPDDKKFLGVYEVAGKHGLIVMMHPDARQETQVENALSKNPDVTFLIHGPEIEDSISGIIERHPNAYYSIDAILIRKAPSPGGLIYTTTSKEELRVVFEQNFGKMLDDSVKKWKPRIEKHPDRYVWGTDRAYKWHYNEEVSILIEEFARAFIAKLDQEVQEKFAYENAEKLLQK